MTGNSLYGDAFVWDAHAGVFPDPGVDLAILEDWRRDGVNYISMNVGFDVLDHQQTMSVLAHYRRYVLQNSDKYVLASTLDDIREAEQSGRLAVSFDIEGMNALNGDVDMVDVYHALGVRQMLFAYNLGNLAAGGCHDENTGLTDFGKAVVRRMNDLGVLVDCSHVSYQTSMDLIAESSKPVVFSHSNPNAIWRHGRNIDDDQIKACADTGGVVGINGMGIFLGDNVTDNETVLRHIRYLADLVGTDHIGLGLDFSPQMDLDVGEILRSRPDYWPKGNQYDTRNIGHVSPQQLSALTEMMQQAGFNDRDVRNILGENFRRVVKAVWAA